MMKEMDPFAEVTAEDYERLKYRRFGGWVAERMDNPLWHAAVHSQRSASWIASRFSEKGPLPKKPRWCFDRYGMSCTPVTEHPGIVRHLWIGGEHEDSYDPDFCIYNDVVITSLDGTVEIYGFPPDHFPPTDFHSATSVGGFIYVIGRLGYREERILGTTPVYRLDLEEMLFTEVEVPGEEPSWLHGHQALFVPGLGGIAVWGGYTIDLAGERNRSWQGWLFSLETCTWSKLDSLDLSLAWEADPL
jgi:hypothetical protein